MRFTAKELKITFSLAAIFMVRMLGLFMILPVLSLYASKLPDATPSLIGIGLGIYGLTQAFLQIPFGILSDRFGRKPLIFLGLITFLLGSLIAANSSSIWWLIIGRAVQGFGAIGSTLLALLSDLTRDEVRPKAMAIVGISIGLSFALSVVLGPVITSNIGLSGLFYSMAGCALLALWILALLPNPTHACHKGLQTPIPGQLKALLVSPPLWRLNLGVLIIHATLASLFLVIPQKLQSFTENVGVPSWQMYLGALVVSIVLMGAFLRRGETSGRILCGAAIVMAVSLCSLESTVHFWPFMIAFSLFFTSFNWLEAQLPSLVSRYVSSYQRGSALGLFSTFQFLGIFIGGVIGGWILEHYGAFNLILIFCLILLSWSGILVTLKAPKALEQIKIKVGLLDENSVELLIEQLYTVSGVVDAVVLADEGVAHLKVDEERLDLVSLQRFGTVIA